MSAAFPEKVSTHIRFPRIHKSGGLVRLPREIVERRIVPMGQFLAGCAAIEFARLEDNWGFLADGGASFEHFGVDKRVRPGMMRELSGSGFFEAFGSCGSKLLQDNEPREGP